MHLLSSSDIYNNPTPSASRADINPSKKISILSTESLSDYLKKKEWPESPKRKNKRQIERVPSVISSISYLDYAKENRDKKAQEIKEKENRKRVREEKKIQKCKGKGAGKRTKIIKLEDKKQTTLILLQRVSVL